MDKMEAPLMSKAIALWLIENTTLTFQQIADFCKLHHSEIVALDHDSKGIMPMSPIDSNQLTKEEIIRCTNDKQAQLQLSQDVGYSLVKNYKHKGAKYIPISRRRDKPDAILWLITFIPSIKDQEIIKLIGTTKTTINNIRNNTHSNISNIRPINPALLGLCTHSDIELLTKKYNIEDKT